MEGALHESVPEAVRRLLRRRMPPATPYTFTHGDLSYGNIMVKDGSVTGIIDWETAAYMPVWCESLCVSFSGCEEDEEWRMLLRNYMLDYDAAYNFWHQYHYLCLDPNIWGRHFIDEAEREARMNGIDLIHGMIDKVSLEGRCGPHILRLRCHKAENSILVDNHVE